MGTSARRLRQLRSAAIGRGRSSAGQSDGLWGETQRALRGSDVRPLVQSEGRDPQRGSKVAGGHGRGTDTWVRMLRKCILRFVIVFTLFTYFLDIFHTTFFYTYSVNNPSVFQALLPSVTSLCQRSTRLRSPSRGVHRMDTWTSTTCHYTASPRQQPIRERSLQEAGRSLSRWESESSEGV